MIALQEIFIGARLLAGAYLVTAFMFLIPFWGAVAIDYRGERWWHIPLYAIAWPWFLCRIYLRDEVKK